MIRRGTESETNCCPFIDLNDRQCARHFKLSGLSQAFSVCLGNYHGCPIYHRLVDSRGPVISLTVAGRAASGAAALGAAGT